MSDYLIDEQITYIVVELGKFNKTVDQLDSELDKLLFFMKTVSNLKSKDKLPKYFSEDWLDTAIKKLEMSNLTKEQKMVYEMEIAGRKAIELEMEAREKKGEKRGEKRGEKKKEELVIKFLLADGKYSIREIAQIAQTTEKRVLGIQKKMKK